MITTKICPNCGGSNITVYLTGWKCLDCGFTGINFPEMEKFEDDNKLKKK